MAKTPCAAGQVGSGQAGGGAGWGRIRLVPREVAHDAAGTTWRPRGGGRGWLRLSRGCQAPQRVREARDRAESLESEKRSGVVRSLEI